MAPNIGTLDRWIRIVVGSALLIAVVNGQIGAWGWIGVVPLLTGILRWCPAYLPFGVKTCSTPDH